MLRASIEYQGRGVDLRVVTEGSKIGDAGISHGEKLVAFAEAAVSGDLAQLETARDELRAAIGSEGLVDAAGVVGNFQRMVRIADGTGIPVDTVVRTLSQDFREEIGIDEYRTNRGKALGPVAGAAAPIASAAVRTFMRVAGKRSRKKGAV